MPSRTIRPRRRRLLIAVATAFALLFLTWMAAGVYGSRRLEAARRTFEAEVGPLPPSYPVPRTATAGTEAPARPSPAAIAALDAAAALELDDDAGALLLELSNHPVAGWSADQRRRAEAALASRPGIDSVGRALAGGEARLGIDLQAGHSAEIPDARPLLRVARALGVRAVLALEAGRWDDALADAATLAGIETLLGHEPVLLTQILATAIARLELHLLHQAMADPRVPPAVLEALARTVTGSDAVGGLRRALVTEASLMSQGIADTTLADAEGSPLPLPSRLALEPMARLYAAAALDSYRNLTRLSDLPSRELARGPAAIVDGPAWTRPMVQLLMPNITDVVLRVQATSCSARQGAMAAVLRRQAASAGAYPASLEAEPCAAGEQIRYRRRDDGGAELAIPDLETLWRKRGDARVPPLLWTLPATPTRS